MDSIALIVLVGLVFLLIMCGSLWYFGKIFTNAKSSMKSLVFESIEDYQLGIQELKKVGVFYSDMEASPSVSSFNELGTFAQAPKVLWIRAGDVVNAEAIMKSKFTLSVTEFGFRLKKNL